MGTKDSPLKASRIVSCFVIGGKTIAMNISKYHTRLVEPPSDRTIPGLQTKTARYRASSTRNQLLWAVRKTSSVARSTVLKFHVDYFFIIMRQL